jgi:putative membrane protein
MVAGLFIMALYTILVDKIDSSEIKTLAQASITVFGTTVLGVLLVFRTNTANERWWEGRKLWGQLVNDSRNLAVKVNAFMENHHTYRQEVHRILVAFAFALKDQLRNGVQISQIPGFETSSATPEHVPLYLSELLCDLLKKAKNEGLIDGYEHLQLDVHSRALMDICGGCERIRNSPIPLSYRALIRQALLFGLIALPWELTPDFHIWTIPVVLLASYFFIGLELIAEDIEEPFGIGDDNLPLESYCKTIEHSVAQVLHLPATM